MYKLSRINPAHLINMHRKFAQLPLAVFIKISRMQLGRLQSGVTFCRCNTDWQLSLHTAGLPQPASGKSIIIQKKRNACKIIRVYFIHLDWYWFTLYDLRVAFTFHLL